MLLVYIYTLYLYWYCVFDAEKFEETKKLEEEEEEEEEGEKKKRKKKKNTFSYGDNHDMTNIKISEDGAQLSE